MQVATPHPPPPPLTSPLPPISIGGFGEGYERLSVGHVVFNNDVSRDALQSFSSAHPLAATSSEPFEVLLRASIAGAPAPHAHVLNAASAADVVNFSPSCCGFTRLVKDTESDAAFGARSQSLSVASFFVGGAAPRYGVGENVAEALDYEEGQALLCAAVNAGWQARVGVHASRSNGDPTTRKRGITILAAPGEALPAAPASLFCVPETSSGRPLPDFRVRRARAHPERSSRDPDAHTRRPTCGSTRGRHCATARLTTTAPPTPFSSTRCAR